MRRALLEAARGHSAVLADPRPQVQLRRFGESSLDCELLVWTRDPRNQQRLVSDLNFRIEQALRRHGIGIPFPQRDLHLRSPALERALEAWRRRSGEADAAPLATSDLATPAPEAPGTPRDCGPDEWSDAEIAAAAARLREGVPIRDRRHRLSFHRRCFVGAEAVDWLVANEGLSRAEALALGRQLVASGLVHHVLDEHDFRDGFFFYRFRADQSAPVTGDGFPGIEASDQAAR